MRVLIFDGNNAAWRLQKRMPELTAKSIQIQVVYGFLRLVRTAIAKFEPNVALVCWDSGHSEFRKNIFKDYKANRDHFRTREDRKEYESVMYQLSVLKTLLKHLNVVQISYPNTEGDDQIAIACHCLGGHKTIISSDQDMLQLVGSDVDVWSPIKEELYTEGNFRKKLGMSPRQWLEFRTLVGDSGDNIPGIAKGFGEETARELIDKYESITNLYKPSTEKKVSNKGNRYALLYSEGAKIRAYRNLLLMDLRLIPVSYAGSEKIIPILKKRFKDRGKVDRVALQQYFVEKGFVSLLKDMPHWLSPFESLDVEI